MRDLVRFFLPLACVLALSGCVLPFDGAPCKTDLNCPSQQYCEFTDGVGRCAVGSSSTGGGGGSSTGGGSGGGDTGGGGGSTTGGGGGSTMGGGGGSTMGGGGGSTMGGGGGSTMGGGGGSTTGGGSGGGDTGGGGGSTTGGGGGSTTGGGGGSTSPDAGSDAGCGTFCSLTGVCACAIFDARPAMAPPGTVITLEGRFNPTGNTVVFPGGVSVSATVLSSPGSTRIQVQVPFDGGVGPLALNIPGMTVAGPRFRTLTFTPGLGRFDDEFDQTAYGIAMPPLPEALEGHSATAIGDWLYVIGGTFVQRARINADDTLGRFKGYTLSTTTLLPSPRIGHTVHVLGSVMYLVGGTDLLGTHQAAVLQSPIASDGSLGPFTAVPGVSLRTARVNHGSVIVGDGLYVIGGRGSAGTPLNTVERAEIRSDGTLAAFEIVPATLDTARSHFGLAASATNVFVVGGRDAMGPLNTVEQASTESGFLQRFTPSSGLITRRQSPLVALIDGKLNVVGGRKPASDGGISVETSAESAQVTLAGLSFFVPEPTKGFQSARYGAAQVIIGNHLFALGGADQAPLVGLERASLSGTGDFRAPSSASTLTVGTTFNGRPVVIGRKLFLVGADSNGAILEASIDAEGRLGSFTAVLDTDTRLDTMSGQRVVRLDPALAVVGDQLVVIGGTRAGELVASTEVVRFTWNGSSLTQLPASPPLYSPRAGAAAVCRGTWVYVVGGQGAFTSGLGDPQIEALNVLVSPLEETFTRTTKQLSTARGFLQRYVGRRVHVFGGSSPNGVLADEVAGWAMADSTVLDSFVPLSISATDRAFAATAAIGPWVYLMGGRSGNLLSTSVLRAGFSATTPGDLQTFAPISNGAVTVPASAGPHTAVVIGNSLHYFAGNQVARYELR